MSHPTYSPAFAQNKLHCQRFLMPDEAVDEFNIHILKIPQWNWQKCYENLFNRMQNTLKNNQVIFNEFSPSFLCT